MCVILGLAEFLPPPPPSPGAFAPGVRWSCEVADEQQLAVGAKGGEVDSWEGSRSSFLAAVIVRY